MMNDEIKEILDDLLFTTTLPNVSIKLNKEKLNQLKDYITNLQHIEDLYNQLLKDYDELQQEIQRKDNNWNELKEFILNHYIVGHTVQNGSLDMIINKMKELENIKNEEK